MYYGTTVEKKDVNKEMSNEQTNELLIDSETKQLLDKVVENYQGLFGKKVSRKNALKYSLIFLADQMSVRERYVIEFGSYDLEIED